MKEALRNLSDAFNFEELQSLALDLGIDWDALPGQTRTAKAGAMLKYADESNTLDKLLLHAAELRPYFKW